MGDISKSQTVETHWRFPILDALRIFLAFWVTMGHFSVFPLFAGVDTDTKLGRTLVHGWSSLVWGVPAVICFFVISGFCIHLPFKNVNVMPVARYYMRRYIRILVPVSAAIAITQLTGDRQMIFGKHDVLWSGILWSLFCEEIYYAVYPAARWVRNRFGWVILLAPAFIFAAILAAACQNALNGSFLGALEAAAILYPIWLLGCLLAEQSDQISESTSTSSIWRWRFLIWLGSWLCEMLHFKFGVTRTQAMLCFGVLAYFWIQKELEYSKSHPTWTPMASAGAWSYSLYLMHIPALMIFNKLRPPSLGYTVDWCATIAFIMGLSYFFYLCVERPSHRLARRFGATSRGGEQLTKHDVIVVAQPSSSPGATRTLNP
jgi:peptidoglycan/LPS O-acetylase OafA/YrhL